MIIQVLFLIALPAAILAAVRRYRPLRALGATLLSYAAGIAIGNWPGSPVDPAVSMRVAEAAVPLSIPFLLFSTDFVAWLRLARKTVLSFVLLIAAGLVGSAAGALIFAARIPEWWQLAGMFVGVYTGGTANLTAIGLALGVREETFVLVNAADVLVGSVYLLFLLSVAQRLLLRFLPPFRGAEAGAAAGHPESEVATAGTGVRPWSRDLATGGALTVAIVAASVGLALAVTGRLSEPLIILAITTLGVGASFSGRVRALRGTYDTGQYLLLIFCLAIGSTANFRELTGSLTILYYCAVVVAVTVLLHFALAALFRIDADTVIITSTAGIFSPPFVGPVAAALRNPQLVVSGLTTGVVGYAVGNYLGLALAYLLRP